MGRSARDRRPHVRPVEKIELSTENTTLRAVAAVLFLMIGAGALVYAVNQLFTTEPGWQTIEAETTDGPSCGEEFVFLYELGAEGNNATAENRALTKLYTQACTDAYRLFHTGESFEGMVNLHDINQRPNEVLEVDGALYRAFEAVQEAGDRTLYLGPVAARYDDLFYCEDDAQLVDFDPRLSAEVAEEYAAAAAFAVDPEQIDVELLGENRICLKVSEEYLAYAQREEIARFLDFGWMRNAFVADYLADIIVEAGYTRGTISSLDGFVRCLDGRTGSYGVDVLAQPGDMPVVAGTVHYQGPMSLASLRAFPALTGDGQRYYRLRNGEIRTLYLDPQDGLCRLAVDSVLCWSDDSCARLVMKIAPAFLVDSVGEDALRKLARDGIQYIWSVGKELYASDSEVAVTNLYGGFTLETAGY